MTKSFESAENLAEIYICLFMMILQIFGIEVDLR